MRQVFVAVVGVSFFFCACPRFSATVQPNNKPKALADIALQDVGAGATVVLDGTPSSDADDDPLTFRWSQIVDGASTPVALTDADQAAASFIAPGKDAQLFFQLVVNDGFEDSVPFVVQVNVSVAANAAPRALATEALTAVTGDQVVLDGSASSDPDGAPLTFAWTQLEEAGADPVNLVDAATSVARFTAPDQPQRLFFQLIVNDGVQDSTPFVVHVDVDVPPNAAPVAEAAEEEVAVDAGDTVVLDGSSSADSDEDALTFLWTQVSGELVNFGDATQAVVSFTAPLVDDSLVFALVVNDGTVDSQPFVVRVNVRVPPDLPPTAAVNATVVDANAGDTVVMDASGSSDPEARPLQFRWEQVDDGIQRVNVDGAQTAVASFRAPAAAAQLFFQLTVSDGVNTAPPVVVEVNVRVPPNLPPVVSVPSELLAVGIGDTVVLDASDSSDPENGALSFSWEQVESGSVPVNLSNPLTAVASFRAPDSPARLFFRLLVSDGVNTAPPFVVQVDVSAPPPNELPIAIADVDLLQVRSGESVSLTSAGSFDPDGDGQDDLTFQWSLLDGPDNGLALFSPPTADIAAPDVQLIGRGSYFFSLVVTDEDGDDSSPATVRVDVLNNPPSASAGLDTTTENGAQVTVVGVANDVDGDDLRFAWTLVEFPPGGRVSLTGPDTPAVRFTPTKKTAATDPAQCGPDECYVLELIVSDGREASPADRVVVTSLNRAPIADPGPNSDDVGGRIVLDGTGSSDEDDDLLVSFTWTQVGGPQIPDGPVFLGAAQDLTPPTTGVFTFELIVNDGTDDSAPERVSVTVGDVNDPPVLSVASTRFVVAEGQSQQLSASASDINGDIVEVVWTLVSGSTRFPQQLVGTNPSIIAPGYLDLLDDPTSNRAVYSVVASDGDAQSPAQEVEVFSGPGAGFVIVSTSPNATSTACGTIATPCNSLAAAVLALDPDLDGVGDGRDVILVADTFTLAGATVPGRTSILGGRDPQTFQVVGETDLVRAGNLPANRSFLFFSSASQDAVVERIAIHSEQPFSSATGDFRGITCSGCTLTVRNSSVEMAGTDVLNIIESAGAANLVVDGVVLFGDATVDTRGVLVNGGEARITDTIITCDTGGGTSVVEVRSGSVTIDRTRLFLTGNSSDNNENGLAVFGGSVLVTNTMISMSSPGGQSAVQQSGGTGAYFNNTFFSPGGNTGTSGIETNVAIAVHGTIISGFNFAVFLNGLPPKSSRIYGNNLNATGTVFTCNIGNSDVPNATVGQGCNGSTQDWTGNFKEACAFVDPVGGDLHLNPVAGNPCIDTGLTSSPAGVGSAEDLDQDARGTLPDVGADEVIFGP